MSSSPKDHDAIVPMPPAPVQSATTPDGQRVQADAPAWNGWLDRAISVQRPAVVAHVARVRRRHPDASPAQVIEILERQYLTAVTSGGAAVGASAVIPGVGMIASLGLSGAETVGFLEASALFAQSVTEVHGITVEDPERARALVMAMMLGAPGTQLVKQLAGQAGGGQGRTAFWGELVTSSLPKSAISGIGGKLRASFVKRFLTRQGTSVLGRAHPVRHRRGGRRARQPRARSQGRAVLTQCVRPAARALHGRARGLRREDREGAEAAEQAAAACPGPRSRPLTLRAARDGRGAGVTDGRLPTSWWGASRPSSRR